MGLCKSKTQSSENNILYTTIDPETMRNVKLNVVVQMSKNENNESEFQYLKNLIETKYPNSSLSQQKAQSSNQKLFNVFCDGKLLHSLEYEGVLKNKTDAFLQELSRIASNKLITEF